MTTWRAPRFNRAHVGFGGGSGFAVRIELTRNKAWESRSVSAGVGKADEAVRTVMIELSLLREAMIRLTLL